MGKGVAILGMHRSGTSCLTGLLGEAGVFLADVSRSNPYNKKGNHERRDIMILHDRVLAASDGSWDSPPDLPVSWPERDIAELERLISDYAGHPIWAFKDPRSLLLLEGWLQAVPTLKLIGTFRHPQAVAISLNQRSTMPERQCFDLWLTYNSRLLQFHDRYGFDLMNFDLNADQYLATARAAMERLGLDIQDRRFEFYEESLRTSGGQRRYEKLPRELELVYSELLERSCTA